MRQRTLLEKLAKVGLILALLLTHVNGLAAFFEMEDDGFLIHEMMTDFEGEGLPDGDVEYPDIESDDNGMSDGEYTTEPILADDEDEEIDGTEPTVEPEEEEEETNDETDVVVLLTGDVVEATPSAFVYPTTFAGWAPGVIDFQVISFMNTSIYAIQDITVSIEPYGATTQVVFEQYSVGLGVGSGAGAYNMTTTLQPSTVNQPSHIRLRPVHGTPIGTFDNLLVLENNAGFRFEMVLTVTIEPHPGGVANPAVVDFGVFEEGYMLLYPFVHDQATHHNNQSLMAAQTGPQAVVVHAPLWAMNNVTLTWAEGNYFDIFRGLNLNQNLDALTNVIPLGNTGAALRQIRVRPIVGLSPGIYEDVLIIHGDGGALIEVPVRVEVVAWDGAFQYTITTEAPERSAEANPSAGVGYIDFGTRLLGYPAYGFGGGANPRAGRVFIENESLTRGIHDLQFQLSPNSPFELDPEGLRFGFEWGIRAAPINDIEPYHETTHIIGVQERRGAGQLRIRPRQGLATGVHEDTLTIFNNEGFYTAIDLRFEVIIPPADIIVTPNPGIFPDQYVGYNFSSAGNVVHFMEFILNNLTDSIQPVSLSFAQGDASPFLINRGITYQSHLNPAGPGGVINEIGAYRTAGLRLIPRMGLSIGTHTDYLILTFEDGSYKQVLLSFTVLPIPDDQTGDITVTPGRVYHFTPRHYNYEPVNNNQWWSQINIHNHTGALISGVTARFELGEDSPFLVNRHLGSNTAGGTGAPINLAATGGNLNANIRVWPRVGLPIGIHRDVLIFENATGFRTEVVLYFEVVEMDVSIQMMMPQSDGTFLPVSTNSYTWDARHPGYFRDTPTGAAATSRINVPYHFNPNLEGSPVGLAEFVITNHSSAPLQLPLWGNNEDTRDNFWANNTQAFQVFRGPSANSLVNRDFGTQSNATTAVVAPGASVSLRFHPCDVSDAGGGCPVNTSATVFPRLPLGVHTDTFLLQDVFGNHFGEIDLSFEVIPWNVRLNREYHDFGIRQIGYTINTEPNGGMGTGLPAQTPETSNTNPDVFGLNVRNLRADGNVEAILLAPVSAPNGIRFRFERGADSPFRHPTQPSGANEAVPVTSRIGLDALTRNFWITPHEGLNPGLHEDYFIIESTRDPFGAYYPLVRFPLRIYIEQPEIEVTFINDGFNNRNGEIVDREVGITVPNRSPGYSVISGQELRLAFENQSLDGLFRDVTATIVTSPENQTPSPYFNVIGSVNQGITSNTPTTDFGAGDFVNVLFWQQSTLNIGTYIAYLRLGNPHGFEIFVPITFTVDDYITVFDPIDFGTRGENYVPSELTHNFTLRNNSPTAISTTGVALERCLPEDSEEESVSGLNGVITQCQASPFVLSNLPGSLANPGAVAGIIDDTLYTLSVEPVPGLAPGLHYDYIVITGNFGFTRRVRVEIYVEVVYHDVTFDLQRGTGNFPTQDVRHNQTATQPTNAPTRVGYAFIGWYTAPTGGTMFDFATPITQDITLYARWVELYHDVTFDLQGGTGNFPLQTVRDGQTPTEPASTNTPTRTGWTFIGWYTAPTAGTTFDFTTPVTNDTTVYAHWTRIELTVTFDLQGGTGSFPDQTVYHGEEATQPTAEPTRTGWTFTGWHSIPMNQEENETIEPTGLWHRFLNFIGFDVAASTTFDFATPIITNTTIYAHWERIQLTVTFDLQSGTGNFPDQTVYHGEVATRPTAEPTRTGWTFVGWYDGVTGQNPFDFTTPITENTTIFARWQRIPVTVTFNLNGGVYAGNNSLLTQTIYHGEDATALTTTPTRTGWLFTGWSPALNLTSVTENRTFVAQWERITFTVNFNLNGGTYRGESALLTQTVNHSEHATALTADPVRTGWTFTGWSPALNLTNVTENRTFTAQWERIPVTLTFDLQGGAGNFPQQTVYHGEMPTAPTDTPNLTGWAFLGWFNEPTEGELFDFDAPLTQNTTIFARWQRIEVNVTFNLNEGSYAGDASLLNQTIYHGQNATALSTNPTRTGWTFTGWSPALNLENVTESRTFVAQWERIPVTLTFNLQGGTGNFPQQAMYHGEMPTAPMTTPSRTGWTFTGWYDCATNGAPFDFDAPITSNTTVYARWTRIGLTVTFDLQGGVADFPSTEGVNHGDTAIRPANDPTRGGWIFINWYDGATGGNPFDFTTPITEDTTIFARWQRIPVTVTFNLNGGVYAGNNSLLTQTIYHGEDATALTTTPTRTGWTFTGWSPALNLENVTENRTFTAQWERTPVTVTFNLNGGTYTGDATLLNQTMYHGENATALTADPTRAGWLFTGWNPALNLENVTENRTFIAQWERIPVTVTFDLDGGTYAGNTDLLTQTIYHGENAVSLTVNPTRTGWLFTGWEPTLNLNNVTENRTFTAQWEQIELTVTFLLNGGTHAALELNNILTLNHGETATAPTPDPTRIGYTFLGWFYTYEEEEEENTSIIQSLLQRFNIQTNEHLFDFATPITENLTLNARWEERYHQVEFDLQNGTGNIPDQSVRDGQTATIPSVPPTRVGYTFAGWYTTPTGDTTFDFGTTITTNTTVYARWLPLYHTVTFDLQGGAGNFPDQNVRHGQLATAPTGAPTRTGWTFIGWYNTETGGQLFEFNTPITSDTTIFARFEPTETTAPTDATEPTTEETAPSTTTAPENSTTRPLPTDPSPVPWPTFPVIPPLPTDPQPTTAPNTTAPTTSSDSPATTASEDEGRNHVGLPQTGTNVIRTGLIGLGLVVIAGSLILFKRNSERKHDSDK